MNCSTKRVHFGSLYFDVYSDVYEPAEDSFLFADNLDVKSDEKVLDIGTGCGILSVLAAQKSQSVVAVDLNPYAIRCAKQNAKLNGVCGISFVQGDLFTFLKTNVHFDLILFNAPYLPSEDNELSSWIGRAWAGGANGREVVDRFISKVASYLKKNGRVLLMQSTLTGVNETILAFNRQGLTASVIADRNLPFFETLTLIEAKANPENLH